MRTTSAAALPLVLAVAIVGCPGNPIEAEPSTQGGEGSSGGEASETTANPTSAGSVSGATTQEPGTSGTSDTPSTLGTGESDPGTSAAGESSGATGSSSEATTLGSDAGTSSSEGAPACAGDEDVVHDDASTAIQFPDLDCNSAVQHAVGVLDAATGIDWWWFYGTDSVGTCEPDSVRVTVTAGGPLPVCALVQPGCTTACTVGAPDGSGRGCCASDAVELVPDCGTDDNTSITFSFGDGSESCRPYAFDYEF